MERHCTRCDYKETKSINKTDHVPAVKKDNEKTPTCTEEGSYVLVTYCSECNVEIKRETVTVPALGHDMTEWKLVKAPTYTEKGKEECHCNRCDYKEERDIDMLENKKYTVIFKPENGESDITVPEIPEGKTLGDIKPIDPTKDGNEFKGWKKEGEDEISPDSTPINGDYTFIAVYEPTEPTPAPEPEPDKVNVTFIDYDDSVIDRKEVDKNSTLGSINEPNPSRENYRFVGWCTDGVIIDDNYVITKDTTFKAEYLAKEVIIIQIDGTLLDKNGKPISNAVVTLHSTVRQTVTDENGYYIFKNVELEEHEVKAEVETTEVYKYQIDATDVANIKKVLESQDKNYDVDSNISEKEGIVTITLNAQEKGQEPVTPPVIPIEPVTPPVTPIEPGTPPVTPTEPVIRPESTTPKPTPKPEPDKEIVHIDKNEQPKEPKTGETTTVWLILGISVLVLLLSSRKKKVR